MMVGHGGNDESSEKPYFKDPTEIPSVSLPQFHIPESTWLLQLGWCLSQAFTIGPLPKGHGEGAPKTNMAAMFVRELVSREECKNWEDAPKMST